MDKDIPLHLFLWDMEQHLLLIKNGKTKFTSWGKLMTEFQFYNQLDQGPKDKKKPMQKYGFKPTQDQTEKQWKHFRVNIKLTVIKWQTCITVKID